MKSFKEYSMGGYLPVDQYRPIADIGNMKSPEPRPKFAINANAQGPGLGTFQPMMNITAQKKQKKNLKTKEVRTEDLYSDDNPNDTVKGTGYGDVATAKKTLNIIKKVDKQRQMQIVNTLYNRAKHHANRTSDMEGAMNVFKNWISKNKEK